MRMATGSRRKELEEGLLRLAWNAGHFPQLVEVHGGAAQQRLKVLHDLLITPSKDGRLFEIRLVPKPIRPSCNNDRLWRIIPPRSATLRVDILQSQKPASAFCRRAPPPG